MFSTEDNNTEERLLTYSPDRAWDWHDGGNCRGLAWATASRLARHHLGRSALWSATNISDRRICRPRNESYAFTLNLHGHIEILEQPGGDPTKTKIYLGPIITSPGADLVPVTLQFVDPHHTHHPDMLIVFQDTHVVFHNVQNTFQP